MALSPTSFAPEALSLQGESRPNKYPIKTTCKELWDNLESLHEYLAKGSSQYNADGRWLHGVAPIA